MKEKYAHAFQVSTDNLDTEVESCEHYSHLERLITSLKEEVKKALRWKKIQLLALEAESWTTRKTIEEFSGTEHEVKQARKLKEKGTLANPEPKRSRPLSQEIVERVQEFY